jgi:Flp pilus assembly protein TadG
MHNLLRCRRGSAAFATVVALVPLIGVVALGGEAGSWYVTRQHAQNAADAAAYSGAPRLACTTETVAYRGAEFAAQNGFCNAGDTTAYPGRNCATSLPTGTSQAVTINIGVYASGTWTTSASGTFVQATVQQTQPVYLAAVLGLSTVNIGAQAIAKVNSLPTPPWVLALSGPIRFQGNPNINAPNCGIASNDPANNALDFTGGVSNFNVGSISAVGGCTPPSDSHCSGALTYMPPVTDPFVPLDTAMTSPSNLTLSKCKGSALVPYTTGTPCANDTVNINAATTISTSGVYFFSGNLSFNGNGSLTTGPGVTATIILLPGASLSMVGGSSITITAQASVPTSELPSQLQSNASLLSDMAIYDTESGTPKINGNPAITVDGVFYAPNMNLSFKGHPTINPVNTVNNCSELIAASIELVGSPQFKDSGCSPSVVPQSYYVSLVQ